MALSTNQIAANRVLPNQRTSLEDQFENQSQSKLLNSQNFLKTRIKLTDWQLIEDTNSAEIVSDPYRRTQQDKEMDKAHFLLDLNKNLIRFRRTEIARTYVPRHS